MNFSALFFPTLIERSFETSFPKTDDETQSDAQPLHSQPCRSPKSAAQREEDKLDRIASKIAANVLVITLPRSLEEYAEESARKDRKTIDKFNNLCEQLLSKDAQCMSARFVDSRSQTIFVYLGRRFKTSNHRVSEIFVAYNIEMPTICL